MKIFSTRSVYNETPSYVELNGEIKPDVPVNLELILKNDEVKDSTSMYIKFMFNTLILSILGIFIDKINNTRFGYETIFKVSISTANLITFMENFNFGLEELDAPFKMS